MFEGLRDAFEYVTGLKEESMKPIVETINGKIYCNKNLVRYGKEDLASSLDVNTLSAMAGGAERKDGVTYYITNTCEVIFWAFG